MPLQTALKLQWHMSCTQANRDSEILKNGGGKYTIHRQYFSL